MQAFSFANAHNDGKILKCNAYVMISIDILVLRQQMYSVMKTDYLHHKSSLQNLKKNYSDC